MNTQNNTYAVIERYVSISKYLHQHKLPPPYLQDKTYISRKYNKGSVVDWIITKLKRKTHSNIETEALHIKRPICLYVKDLIHKQYILKKVFGARAMSVEPPIMIGVDKTIQPVKYAYLKTIGHVQQRPHPQRSTPSQNHPPVTKPSPSTTTQPRVTTPLTTQNTRATARNNNINTFRNKYETLKNYKAVYIKPDGDCLFSAVARGNNPSSNRDDLVAIANILRGQAVDYICKNKNDHRDSMLLSNYSQIFKPPPPPNNENQPPTNFVLDNSQFRKYCIEMKKSGIFATENEISVLPKIIERPIAIYRQRGDNFYIQVMHGEEYRSKPPILLKYNYPLGNALDGHYELLIPK